MTHNSGRVSSELTCSSRWNGATGREEKYESARLLIQTKIEAPHHIREREKEERENIYLSCTTKPSTH